MVFRLIAFENLPDLEQAGIGKAVVGVALRCRDKARNKAGSHIGQFSRNRICKRKFRLATAEQFGLCLRYKRPGDGLDEPACGERALCLAGTVLDRGQHWLAGMLAREPG